MAKTSTTSKQSKKQTSDCHCGESKPATKSKNAGKSKKVCDCTDCK